MSNHDRPVSPHLSIYRWPITMTLSILHRGTGVALSIGFVVLAMWLFQAAAGPENYSVFMSLVDTKVGVVLLVGWSFRFSFIWQTEYVIWFGMWGMDLRFLKRTHRLGSF